MRARVVVEALLVVLTLLGCSEHQFLLRVRDPAPITVTSQAEPVRRSPAREPKAGRSNAPFDDRGVILRGGYEHPYPRDRDWIVSKDPIRFTMTDDRVSLGYTMHPGRRDVPLLLTTPRDNVCELLFRKAPSRGLGATGLVLAATLLIAVPAVALTRDEGTRRAAPYLAAGAAAFAAGGTVWLLWPAGEARVLLPDACKGAQGAQ